MLLWLGLLVASVQPVWAGETVYATKEIASTRFSDEDVKGPSFKKDERLEVLFRKDDKVRVTSQGLFGWVSAGDVTDAAPMPEIDFSKFQGLQLPPPRPKGSFGPGAQ